MNFPLTLKFHEFVKSRRIQLGLQQDSFRHISRSYIATIESGRQPLKKEDTLQKLYEQLHISQMKKSYEWFYVYALLDQNPDLVFGRYEKIENPLIIQMIKQLQNLSPQQLQLASEMIGVLNKVPPPASE